MTKFGYCVIACGLFSLAACNRSEPGGGAARATKFTLDGPVTATSITQGESKTVNLTVNRGKDFKESVKLKAEPPAGIEATVSGSPIPPTEKGNVSVVIAASKNAAPGEHVIRITATPDKGEATHLDVKVKVAARADAMKLMLKGPSGATTIKQGEAQTLKITFEPNDKYLADVKLEAKAPKGIKAELMPSTMRAADKGEANLLVTVGKSTEVGEHTIQITGAADAAAVVPVEVTIKVVAP